MVRRPTSVLAPRFCRACPYLGRCDHELDGCEDWEQSDRRPADRREAWQDVPREEPEQ